MATLKQKIGPILGTIRAEYRQIANRYFKSIRRFSGNAEEVCQQILDLLWAGDFYRTSLGHYNFFWMRDFGTVAESLTTLVNTTRVHTTLRWALRHYSKAGRITTCIDKAGHTFNAPGKPSIDALPWLLHSIVVSGYILNAAEKEFLSHQLKWFTESYLDASGDLRPNLTIAEMRDAIYYDRSAYAISLIGRMAHCVRVLKLPGFPFTPEAYRAILLEHYWNGSYFNADRTNDAYSSDSALMPFFLKVVDDKTMADETFRYISQKKLNMPYPLKYGEHDNEFRHRFGMGKWIMPNYTGTTIWTWHATFYLHLLRRYNHPDYTLQYKKFARLIEKTGTYPELLNPDASWYNAPFYRSDPGMVWVALFLELPKPK
ncbi:hypothetical protein GW930_02310 [Candidatus Saccharibacteria bacterium]|nr:hypothetical protein [Candidatus Saccharibacteria bacterium]